MGMSLMSQSELVDQVKRERRFRNRLIAYFKSLLGSWTATLGLIIVLVFFGTALFADFIAPYHPTQDDYTVGMPSFQPPFTIPEQQPFPFVFGTDWSGQDIFSRVIHGARSAVLAGTIAISVGLTGGILLGAISGYVGGSIDNILMRVVDAWMSIPSFFMLLIIVAALSEQPWNPAGKYTLLIAMFFVGFMGIPGYARIIRGSVLSVREMDFIDAARATGSSEARIIAKHVIPNVFPIILVYATMGIGGAIMSTAGLSFIGLGARPNQPDWGGDMNGARSIFFQYWWPMFFPGLAIFVVVLGFNLLGDWLRDVLDPRTRDV
ncbi:MAG: ABC transporter permease [Candidatus Heimdallarchaeota archaeon]|nr:ABC transporter permease [Candidatus Heimdallarchaeota archaeon]